MTDSDVALQNAVSETLASAERLPAPDFDRVWATAGARARAARKRRFLLTGAAAVAAVFAVAIGLRAPVDREWRYIDRYELLETTGWSAPSDSLLPSHEFDLYQSVPLLIESTDTYGGALL